MSGKMKIKLHAKKRTIRKKMDFKGLVKMYKKSLLLLFLIPSLGYAQCDCKTRFCAGINGCQSFINSDYTVVVGSDSAEQNVPDSSMIWRFDPCEPNLVGHWQTLTALFMYQSLFVNTACDDTSRRGSFIRYCTGLFRAENIVLSDTTLNKTSK